MKKVALAMLSVLSVLLIAALLTGCVAQPAVSSDTPETNTTTSVSSTTTTVQKTPAEYAIRFEKDTSIGWKKVNIEAVTEAGFSNPDAFYIVDGRADIYLDGKWVDIEQAAKENPAVLRDALDVNPFNDEDDKPAGFVSAVLWDGSGFSHAAYTDYKFGYWLFMEGDYACPLHTCDDENEEACADFRKIHPNLLQTVYILCPPDCSVDAIENLPFCINREEVTTTAKPATTTTTAPTTTTTTVTTAVAVSDPTAKPTSTKIITTKMTAVGGAITAKKTTITKPTATENVTTATAQKPAITSTSTTIKTTKMTAVGDANTTKKTTKTTIKTEEYAIRFTKDTSVGWEKVDMTPKAGNGYSDPDAFYIVNGRADIYLNGKWVDIQEAVKKNPAVLSEAFSAGLRYQAAYKKEPTPKDYVKTVQYKGGGFSHVEYTDYKIGFWWFMSGECPLHEKGAHADRYDTVYILCPPNTPVGLEDLPFCTSKTKPTTTKTTKKVTTTSATTKATTTKRTTVAPLTYDQARQKALDHAGFGIGDVVFWIQKQIKFNGVTCYHIAFTYGDTEYDYKISRATGEIVKYDNDMSNTDITTAAPTTTTTTAPQLPLEYSVRFKKDTAVGWKQLHKETKTLSNDRLLATGSYIIDGDADIYVNGKWVPVRQAIADDPTVLEKVWKKSGQDNGAKANGKAYDPDYIKRLTLRGYGVNYAKYTGFTIVYWTASGLDSGKSPCPVHEYPDIDQDTWLNGTEEVKADYLADLRAYEHAHHHSAWYILLPPDAPLPTWDDIYAKGICFMDF